MFKLKTLWALASATMANIMLYWGIPVLFVPFDWRETPSHDAWVAAYFGLSFTLLCSAAVLAYSARLDHRQHHPNGSRAAIALWAAFGALVTEGAICGWVVFGALVNIWHFYHPLWVKSSG